MEPEEEGPILERGCAHLPARAVPGCGQQRDSAGRKKYRRTLHVVKEGENQKKGVGDAAGFGGGTRG